jgi:DNA-binding NarL/FixJ family response regulator
MTGDPQAQRARVVIADDHELARLGLRTMLLPEPDLEVVGEAATGDRAIELAASTAPDVILMDLKMPGCNGIEATRRILQHRPEAGILVLTMFEDDDSVFAAMRAGARGYLLKGADQEDILRAVRAVADGEAIFGPSIARRVIGYFASPQAASPPVPFPELTEREREVLGLVARGLGNQDIAHRLALTEKTVRNHVSTIFNKLQVAGRAEAIVRAREAGLGT